MKFQYIVGFIVAWCSALIVEVYGPLGIISTKFMYAVLHFLCIYAAAFRFNRSCLGVHLATAYCRLVSACVSLPILVHVGLPMVVAVCVGLGPRCFLLCTENEMMDPASLAWLEQRDTEAAKSSVPQHSRNEAQSP